MIFVNTALDVAHERNKQRSRQVPEKIVTSSWNSVQKNMGKFQYLFGRDKFILIDNNNAKEDLFAKVHKQIRKLVTKPIENWIAKNWIDKELKGKDRS
jgi:thymidylate kinase